MKLIDPKSVSAGALALCLAATAANAATIVTTSADARVRFDGNISSTSTAAAEVGSHGSNYPSNMFRSVFIMPFALPTLGAGESFSNASLSFTVDAIDNISVDQNADLYGMTRIDASDAAIAGDFYEGILDGANTLLQDSILTVASSTGANGTSALGGANLTAFLNAQYAGGANAGDFVFLRLSTDGVPSGGTQRFRIVTANSATPADFATITYDVIPEPSSVALLGLGGLALLRRRR